MSGEYDGFGRTVTDFLQQKLLIASLCAGALSCRKFKPFMPVEGQSLLCFFNFCRHDTYQIKPIKEYKEQNTNAKICRSIVCIVYKANACSSKD
jgi:hypothetical protein